MYVSEIVSVCKGGGGRNSERKGKGRGGREEREQMRGGQERRGEERGEERGERGGEGADLPHGRGAILDLEEESHNPSLLLLLRTERLLINILL